VLLPQAGAAAAAAGSKLQRMPGLTEFLAWLESRSLRKAAVTNAPRGNTELMLSALQLDKYFEAVVLGEECVRAKPHPDPYQQALQLLGLQPHEAIVIEDSPAGEQWQLMQKRRIHC
jgi:HAD superfamily hydrolase (TIGR01509 family)